MGDGLATTFEVLTKTGNEAAIRVLIPALDSPHEPIQESALKAILARRSPAGGREILSRLHMLPQRWKEIIRHRHGRLNRTLRDALLGTDRQMCLNGCRAAVWFREYDLIPTLLNALDDPTRENAPLAAETLLELAEQLCEELAGPQDYSDRRDPQLVRQHVLDSLESSVTRFGHHRRREVLKAFLLLVGRDNTTLKTILQDPHHAVFLPLVDELSHGTHAGVIRLLLSFLDDPGVTSAAISVVAKRPDLQFARELLHKIGREPSFAVRENLKRIRSVGWLHEVETLFEQLDEVSQQGAVWLATIARLSRQQAFSMIECLLLHGKPAGRRAASAALAEFNGADANALALRALDDADPQVQANIIGQLRGRGIPGALSRLLAMVDVPQATVREAVRKALDEFSFGRFIGVFDMLDEEVQRSTGMLVKRIDPQTIPLLQAELESNARTRRLRGLAVAQTIDAVEALEPVIIKLLQDQDHMVRIRAATVLAHGSSNAGREALLAALFDRSQPVQEAARTSLRQRAEFTQADPSLSDPRE